MKLVAYLKANSDLKIIGFDIVGIDRCQTAVKELKVKDDKIDLEQLTTYYEKIKPLYKSEKHFDTINRDTIMAHNLKWIIDDLYKGEKVIISAANDHISKVRSSKYGYMGELLSKEYGERYFTIGFFHSLGDPLHVLRDFSYSLN